MPALRPPDPRAPWPAPDADQARAIAHRGRALLVRGAPGTGKTTTALHLVADRVTSGELATDDVLLLAPTRRAAARLRDELSARLRRTTGAPVVRTPSSAAFAVLRARATLLGEPAPLLISGPEQDLVLADLLAGHAEGEGVPIAWPASVPEQARTLRAFRDELRDLLMRAAERGLGPADLARLGRTHGRPEWEAAAALYAEYLDVTRLRSGTPDAGARYDPAVIVDEAAEALHAWEDEVSAPRPRWRLVVVDDHQESTAATARLLHVLAGDGAELVLVADPDAAVQTFRGASPGLVERATLAPAGSELGAFAADEVVLTRVWRHGAEVRSVVRTVTEQIRGPGRAHRAAAAGQPGRRDDAPAVTVALLRSPAQESAHVAYLLRSAYLHGGVPWRRMAVVVRSGAQVSALRRTLVDAGVPVAVSGSDVPLRAEPAVRPMLLALDVATRDQPATAAEVADLLTTSLGGLDAVGLRRLRRALRAQERAEGGERTSDELLLEVVGDPVRAAQLPGVVRRGAQRLAQALADGRAALAAGGGAPEVLWAMWAAADVAASWQRTALTGGPAGARVDRDLDAVLALFTAAEQFVDRFPQAPAAAFVEHLRAQDLPADSLAPQADQAGAVELLTAAGAAGGEWDLVVVAGVQEGVWPDLRLRDQLLGAQHLVEVLAGRAAPGDGGPERYAQARAAVLDDELRAFAVAVSRARTRLVVTAVRDADHAPSGLVELVQPGPDDDAEPDPRVASVSAALDLRAVVAQARSWLESDVARAPATVGPAEAAAHPAARLLARLVAAGVPGADPGGWYGVGGASTHAPLWPADAVVPLTPSTLETASSCALRWALEGAGGTSADSTEQSLGTLVHAIAAELPQGSHAELAAALDARWSSLDLPEGWVGTQQRRRADSMIRQLAAYLRDAGEVVAVEQPFTAELGEAGRVVLRGVVDRLERVVDPDGEPQLRVVDLKTGKNAVSQEEAARHPQLGAYQLAVEAGAFDDVADGVRTGGAALVYVGTANQDYTTRDQRPLPQDPAPTWAADLVSGVADAVRQSAMVASTGDMCRFCAVRRSCPLQEEGRVVGS
ncbi:ATP-dependent helicase [Actinotalea fermentans]|uniref:DNA 3'-5' helicase n=1 Tax=Actinotalea fermentans TaxID=43671 RepID=A0A511YZP3_9CELL|nr:ATP-dependent DNA helicase [Actinotalea fermentans]GEN80665.1 DNA helicase [Actinotalea fermentans]